MNQLAFRRTDDNGLSFELLVDGEPLGDLIGAQDSAIPYWLIDNDLPGLPPQSASTEPELRIVTVCSCGEYGCAHTRCRVIRSKDSVTFCDFDVDCSADGRQKQFTFARSNYDQVIREIVRETHEFRTTT